MPPFPLRQKPSVFSACICPLIGVGLVLEKQLLRVAPDLRQSPADLDPSHFAKMADPLSKLAADLTLTGQWMSRP
jgi:hypothetical protein